MKKHVHNYLKFFKIGEQDRIPSELSGLQSSDIHHIIYKSQGGKDTINNLIALTREEHQQAHFIKEPYLKKDELIKAHKNFIKSKHNKYSLDNI